MDVDGWFRWTLKVRDMAGLTRADCLEMHLEEVTYLRITER